MRIHPSVRFLGFFFALATSASLSGCLGPLRPSECRFNPGQQLLNEINVARVRAGVRPLGFNQRLARAAETHARALAEGKASGHFGADGSDPLQRITEAGYRPHAFGENIAEGSLAPRLIVEAWLLSPGHRLVLLDPAVNEVGIGGVLDSHHPIWVADFGSGTERAETRCHPWRMPSS